MALVGRQDISVGDDRIDDDHKGLIAIINSAEDVINGPPDVLAAAMG